MEKYGMEKDIMTNVLLNLKLIKGIVKILKNIILMENQNLKENI